MPAGTLFLSLVAALLITVPALFGGNLPVAGQTAGPVATRTAPVVAGPDAAGPPMPAAASDAQTAFTDSGQVAGPAAATPAFNLTPADGVALVAGRSLLFVPPGSASCPATARLSYEADRVEFAATCASGGVPGLSSPALLCMEPSAPLLASALGNLANLSLTRTTPLASHRSPSGVLVCASIQAAGDYSLSVTAKTPPDPASHSLQHGSKVLLPAVGLGGYLDR